MTHHMTSITSSILSLASLTGCQTCRIHRISVKNSFELRIERHSLLFSNSTLFSQSVGHCSPSELSGFLKLRGLFGTKRNNLPTIFSTLKDSKESFALLQLTNLWVLGLQWKPPILCTAVSHLIHDFNHYCDNSIL